MAITVYNFQVNNNCVDWRRRNAMRNIRNYCELPRMAGNSENMLYAKFIPNRNVDSKTVTNLVNEVEAKVLRLKRPSWPPSDE